MTDATLLTDRTRPALRLERHLPDPPETVWQALTDRDQLRSWFPSDLVVHGGRWEVGNTITFEFPPEVVDLTLSGAVGRGGQPDPKAASTAISQMDQKDVVQNGVPQPGQPIVDVAESTSVSPAQGQTVRGFFQATRSER